jgi:hypothetical protein
MWRAVVLFVLLGICTTVFAGETQLQPLYDLLQQSEGEIDFAKAKLTIDALIDPGIDTAIVSQHLDRMTTEIKQQIPPGANRRATLLALLAYLYQPSLSNDFRAFSYDLDDPFGKNLRKKLLTTYVDTHKGNCVSMPILFVILAQKIGLDATLATAPDHVFAKVRDACRSDGSSASATVRVMYSALRLLSGDHSLALVLEPVGGDGAAGGASFGLTGRALVGGGVDTIAQQRAGVIAELLLASAIDTSGNTPRARRFSLPAWRYFIRQ